MIWGRATAWLSSCCRFAFFPNQTENYSVQRNFRLVRCGDRSFSPYLMRIWMVAALGLGSLAGENVAPTKSELEEMYGKAFREFDASNFPQALKELDAIDARQPDLAASKNLRGVILMRQGVYDKAEAALLEAARLDPKFWNARFNLAEIPFLKKDWAAARSRFEERSVAAYSIQDSSDLPARGKRKHGRFHSSQVGTLARYAGG